MIRTAMLVAVVLLAAVKQAAAGEFDGWSSGRATHYVSTTLKNSLLSNAGMDGVHDHLSFLSRSVWRSPSKANQQPSSLYLQQLICAPTCSAHGNCAPI